MEKSQIRIAIVVWDTVPAPRPGDEFYRVQSRMNRNSTHGLMHLDIGGYRPWDIEVGAAFAIDRRKVGRP